MNRGHPSVRHTGDARMLAGVRWRLVLFSAGSTLALLLVLGTALYLSTQASLSATASGQLDARAAEARSILLGQSRPRPDDDDDRFGQFRFGGPQSGTALLLFDSAGQQVLPAGRVISTDLPLSSGFAAALDGHRDIRTATIEVGQGRDKTPVRVLSEAVQVGSQTYVIQVLQDRSTEVRTLTALLAVLGVGGLGVLGAATAFGFVYAGRALVPIRESLRRQREFAADASHELRNPLAVIRGSVEHLRRHSAEPVAAMPETLDDIEAEVRQLGSLVEDLLLLARSDSGGVELRMVPLDLSDVVGEALSSLRTTAEAAGAQISLDTAPAPMQGDPERLRQLVGILVDNAIRHGARGGTISVEVTADGGRTLTVTDEGPGIRPEDLSHVFDRFWRASAAPAGGTGLGLSIAAWIVERHGGTIRAGNREDRQGARFEVRFPA